MAATINTKALDLFDTHPSLSASLEDFENNDRHSPMMNVGSHHSSMRMDSSEPAEDMSDTPWSPPGWRNTASGSGWYRHQPYLPDNSRFRSSMSGRDGSSPLKGARADEDPTIAAANIPLPRGSSSPLKGFSPVPELSPEPERNAGPKAELPPAPNNYDNCATCSLSSPIRKC